MRSRLSALHGWSIGALSAVLLASSGAPARATDQLYRQLGGQQGIARITSGAMTLYFTDPRLSRDFDNINRAWLQPRFESFICAVSGGPCVYKGRSMAASHRGLHIKEARFDAVVEDLQTAMDQAHVPFWTQNKLLAILAPMERDIVAH